jgi:type II secretory pathway pseudopilin PulG
MKILLKHWMATSKRLRPPRNDRKVASKQRGFTLIELVLFIMITGLLASTLLLSSVTVLQKSPGVHNQYTAVVTAARCMEWIIGQRRLKGYTTFSCPSSSTPAFCTAPSGFTVSTNISCTTINGDAAYKTVAITVDGGGSVTMTTLLADY